MLGKISSRSISSYAFASARFVQPCQIRAIIASKRKRKDEEEEEETGSHAHYLVTAINVNDLACDCRGSVTRQENSGGAQLGRIATAFQRCALLIMLQHGREAADAAGGKRLNGSGRNAVHPDFLWAEIVGKITRTGFQTCLGHAHHVVVRHNLFRAVIR